MKAMLFDQPHQPLRAADIATPTPQAGQLLLRVRACGVCRTDLHVADGDLEHPKLPLVLGHEIIGTVEACGDGVADIAMGSRMGVPWLGWTCGNCDYCRRGQENLCDQARFTGYQLDGGYAEYAVADHRYCFPIAEGFSDAHAAAFAVRGLIGYRSLKMAGDAAKLGFYGFGTPLISCCKWPSTSDAKCSHLRRRAIGKASSSLANSARCGPVVPTKCHRLSWMPRSSSHRSRRWCLRPCVWSEKQAWLSAQASI